MPRSILATRVCWSAIAAVALTVGGCGGSDFDTARVSVCNTGTEPMSILAADFNDDGADDLAVACGPAGASSSGGLAQVLLADGHGGFGAPESNPNVGDGPRAVTAADVNGDGRRDLVIAGRGSSEGSATIIYADDDRKGAFGGQTVYPLGGGGVSAIAVADVNSDGDLDVVMPGENRFWEGDGKGLDPLGGNDRLVSGRPDAANVADVDGNGFGDAVVVVAAHGKIHVYANGAQTRRDVVLGKATRGVRDVMAGGDFNGDGEDDLVVATAKDKYTSEVRLALSTGGAEPQLSEPVAGAGDPAQVVAGDFTGDGHRDLIAVPAADPDTESYSLSLMPGDGKGGFAAAQTIPVEGFPYQVAAGDFNGDGTLDFAVRDLDNNRVVLHLNRRPRE